MNYETLDRGINLRREINRLEGDKKDIKDCIPSSISIEVREEVIKLMFNNIDTQIEECKTALEVL